ncbi:MAG TPA: hypothetical protein VGP96_17645 [Candidatus Dormibacteraeota bacterium]|nr:hypothetical protein [Candidatus Dormibacteraeota bacterium]
MRRGGRRLLVCGLGLLLAAGAAGQAADPGQSYTVGFGIKQGRCIPYSEPLTLDEDTGEVLDCESDGIPSGSGTGFSPDELDRIVSLAARLAGQRHPLSADDQQRVRSLADGLAEGNGHLRRSAAQTVATAAAGVVGAAGAILLLAALVLRRRPRHR